jgi:hypothetical protein
VASGACGADVRHRTAAYPGVGRGRRLSHGHCPTRDRLSFRCGNDDRECWGSLVEPNGDRSRRGRLGRCDQWRLSVTCLIRTKKWIGET